MWRGSIAPAMQAPGESLEKKLGESSIIPTTQAYMDCGVSNDAMPEDGENGNDRFNLERGNDLTRLRVVSQ